MKSINIIGHRNIFLSISLALVLASIIAISVFGLKPAIDFVGGTLWQFNVEDDMSSSEIKGVIENVTGFTNVLVQRETSSGSFIARLPAMSEDAHQEYIQAFLESFSGFEELRFESIGPTIGAHLRKRAMWAIALVLLAISLYIAFSFRGVSYPVRSWKYGVTTLITLLHDAIIPTGVLAVVGYIQGLEINTNFIVALLVIVGYSVHDTIVVFDRIRENLLIRRSSASFDEVVNESVNQTIARSINTSLTLVLILLVMFFVGPASLKFFVLIILIGTILGTYSSIFLASPLLTLWHKFGTNKK